MPITTRHGMQPKYEVIFLFTNFCSELNCKTACSPVWRQCLHLVLWSDMRYCRCLWLDFFQSFSSLLHFHQRGRTFWYMNCTKPSDIPTQRMLLSGWRKNYLCPSVAKMCLSKTSSRFYTFKTIHQLLRQ